MIEIIKLILGEFIKEFSPSTTTSYNERYIHHYFSHRLQNKFPIVFNSINICMLHPEWATAKKGTNRCAFYYKSGSKYLPSDKGASGFIDFAIGNLESPIVGIEFKMSKSFNKDGAIFDYTKLLDNRNRLDLAISIDIYYRRSKEIKVESLNENLQNATNILKDSKKLSNRQHYFWVIEYYKDKVNIFKSSGNELKFIKISEI